MIRKWPTVLVVVVALVTVIPPLASQTRTGSINGTIADATGQVLPGVAVTLEGEALIAAQLTTSSDTGTYRFTPLPPGLYTLTYSLSGFKTLVREEVRVDIGKNTAISPTLELATVEEVVTVTGESPMVDTKTTVIGASFDAGMLQDVPSARDVWSLLEHQAPGVTTNRLDVGGSETGLQATYSARGTAWSQNSYYLNGVNVTCPAALGASGYYYDFDSFEEVQVETGSHPASVNAPGVFMNMVTKGGGNKFKGGGSFYYQNDATQAENIDDELRDRGAGRGSEFDYLSDANAQIGGPIVKDRSSFYFSWRDERVHRWVPGFPEVESTDMWQFLIKNQTQISTNNRVGAELHYMSYWKPNRGAADNREPEATWIEDDTFTIIQVEWNSVLSKNALLDTRFSHLKVWFPTYQQPDVTGQSAYDTGTGMYYGARNQDVERDRRRYTIKSDLTYFQPDWGGATHEFKLGFAYDRNPIKNIITRIDDVDLRTHNGVPDNVRLYNTPNINRQAVDQISFFVDDIINVGARVTIKAGVRMDSYEGYLPEQVSPAGTWVDARRFPEQRDVISLTSFAPRLGLVVGLDEVGKTAFKMSWGRFYHQFTTGWPNTVNPNGQLYDRYAWNDLNGDLQFQDGEQGALEYSGLLSPTLLDPDFAHPFTDEFTAGIEREVGKDMAVTATFVYRTENRLTDDIDVGIPFSAYSPVQATDPGPDGVLGTSDDGGQITVYDLDDPSYIGESQPMFSNPEGNEGNYKGLELTLQKRLSDNWSALMSYTYNDTEANTGGFEDPNEQINVIGKDFYDRTHQVKLLGSYFAPHGIRISGVFRYQTGQPYARTFVVSGLTQGSITVNAFPPGTERIDNVATADITFAKSFDVGRGRLTPEASIFNIANANTVTAVRTTSGSAFGRVSNVLPARVFRFGVRFTFED